MVGKRAAIAVDHIESRIVLLRGQKVMLSTHLAELYKVEARILVQAVGGELIPDGVPLTDFGHGFTGRASAWIVFTEIESATVDDETVRRYVVGAARALRSCKT